MNSNPFTGCWRINWMKQWNRRATDLLGPAFIFFDRSGGQFRFIRIDGYMSGKFTKKGGKPHFEFGWAGNDEGDRAGGGGCVLPASVRESSRR